MFELLIRQWAGVGNNKLNGGWGRRAPQEKINWKILFLNPCFLSEHPTEVNVPGKYFCFYIENIFLLLHDDRRTGEDNDKLEVVGHHITRPPPQQIPTVQKFCWLSKTILKTLNWTELDEQYLDNFWRWLYGKTFWLVNQLFVSVFNKNRTAKESCENMAEKISRNKTYFF